MEQAVFVHLDRLHLPESFYQNHDLATLEDRLVKVITENNLGEFDGNEIEMNGERAVLFMYGPDGEALFRGIERILREYPLCRGARVVIRYGRPGSAEREVVL